MSKRQEQKATVKTSDEFLAQIDQKKRDELKGKIEEFNHHFVQVKVKKSGIHIGSMICAKGAKIFVSLSVAQECEARGEVEILATKIVAVQFLVEYSSHKQGDIVPCSEDEAKKLEEACVIKRLSTIDDLVSFD